jgi:hypothetical protein
LTLWNWKSLKPEEELDLEETMLLSAVLLVVVLGVNTAWAAHKIEVVNHCRERFSMQIPGHGSVSSDKGGSWTYGGDLRGYIPLIP